jgi:phosphosulfolactate synthase (CoM biosynthesis protein A)
MKEGDADKLNKTNSIELQELISQMEEEKKKERLEKATAKKLMRISEVPETEPEEEPRRSGRERKTPIWINLICSYCSSNVVFLFSCWCINNKFKNQL